VTQCGAVRQVAQAFSHAVLASLPKISERVWRNNREPSVALSAASFHAPSTPGIREGFHVTRRVGAVHGFTATAHTNGWPLNLKDKKKPVESFGLSHLKSDTHL
jgi:hypothetical protein